MHYKGITSLCLLMIIGGAVLYPTLSFSSSISDETVTQRDVETQSVERDTLSLNKAVDRALENNLAARIAEEEIELSRLKIREARRSLYPSASLNYLETIGTTAGQTQDFTDKEYKLKFEYPLYYGWRLKYAVEKAISNMNASRYNYEKVVQDLKNEVERAFYSYLVSKITVGIHKTLLVEIEKIFDSAEKRFNLELITKSEYLKVSSQLKQVKYQVASSESDLALARLTLAQAMNVEVNEEIDELMALDVDITDIEDLDIDVTLEECLDMAFRYRPDLKAKRYMVDFNDYEQKIQETKDQLKIDLTGSYGESGGAYETESLTMNKDWFIGVQVSKPLGGNTLSTAYTEEETSEKHGQTSRTNASSKSVGFGIIDGLERFSEKKSADISLKKAQQEFQDTRDAILKEVREAYLDYQKGMIQERANLRKIKYREEELKVANARAGLNEIPLSDLVDAHMYLSDEKSYYVEAVGSLYQALVRLNKATGYVLFFDDESFRLAGAKSK